MEHQHLSENAFATYLDEWQRKRTAKDPSADAYFEQHVFPEVFERFKHSAIQYYRRYRGLILVGSGQPDTAALLIAGLDPERVAFLLTATTQQFHERVHQRLDALGVTDTLRCPPACWLPNDRSSIEYADDSYRGLRDDHSTVPNTYRGVRAVLEAWCDLPRDTIAIDLTGGKSTMTVGLAKSAHVLGLQSIYVDSDYEQNQVKQGSQRLALTEDPYLIFGDLKRDEAKRLAAAHDYAGAYRIFSELVESTPGRKPTDADRYFAALCEAYAAWDTFDLPMAQQHLAALVTTLDANGWSILHGAHDRLLFQRDVLSRLTSVHVMLNDSPFDILAHDFGTVLALLGSLYANAIRREQQGRYDFAAFLLYRCLELMSQRRLAVYGINADVEHITLMQGYGRLENWHDPLVWTPSGPNQAGLRLIDHIRATQQARNKSFLAHGFRLIRANEEYKPFRSVVDVAFDRFYTTEAIEQHTGLMRDVWHAQFDFVSLE